MLLELLYKPPSAAAQAAAAAAAGSAAHGDHLAAGQAMDVDHESLAAAPQAQESSSHAWRAQEAPAPW